MEIKKRINVTCTQRTRASTPKGRGLAAKVTNRKSTTYKRTTSLFSTLIACSTITLFLTLFTPTSTTETVSSSSSTTEAEAQEENAKYSTTPEAQVVSDSPNTNCSLHPFHSCNEEDYWVHENFRNDTDNSDYQNLYDVPIYLVVLLSLLYGVISVAAVIGNILVLWVVTVSRRMRTKTNMFIANLALADIMIAIFAIPFQFQAALLQRWNLPYFMCAFCPFVQVLSVNVSVFTLSAIAMDRYRAILYPFKAISISKREGVYAVLTIWSLSLFIALPQELDYKVIELPENGLSKPFCAPVTLSDTFRIYYIYALVVIQYVLPLLIISIAYARMATRLWGTNTPGNKEESRDENTLRNKKKVVKMLAVVVLLFALCWLPLQMYNFFQTITPINEYQYINIIWFCFHWLAMSNSCYNPFIYAIYSDKFQTEFKSRLHCLRMRSREAEETCCSDASDFEMSRARVMPARLSRAGRYSSKGPVRISSIETSRVSDRTSPNNRNILQPKPVPTLCETVQNNENDLMCRTYSLKSNTS